MARRIQLSSAIAYGATMFGSACLNNIFVTYYVELFCFVVKLPAFWFYLGQTIFMMWNSFNDPLFGWLSDNFPRVCGARTMASANRRLTVICWGGLLWAVAFMCVWFPPDGPIWLQGLHFTFALCFYDAMLSLVEVNHQAMLAEISTNDSDRALCNMFSALFAAAGSLSSFFAHQYWDRDDLIEFRKLCFMLALLSVFSFVWSSRGVVSVTSVYSHKLKEELAGYPPKRPPAHRAGKDTVDMLSQSESGSFLTLLKQLRHEPNFLVYVTISFLQGFDCNLEKCFFPIFLASIAAGSVPQHWRSTLVSLSFILPWLCTVLATSVIHRLGLYRTVQIIFTTRLMLLALGLVLLLSIWPSPEEATLHTATTVTPWGFSTVVACMLVLCNRIFCECVCRLSPLIVTDIVDEDMYLYKRQHAVSASITGTAAFFNKLTQSLAPMMGYSVLSSATAAPTTILRHAALFSVFCLIVGIVGSQFYLWTAHFNLHGLRLKRVKEYVGCLNGQNLRFVV